ncbi:F-box/LRR-repeat protein 10 [Amaranthus tricolor]|uniref:F-box/LRR-repeat protein 10 n=1 Tax=Amaranthus tricolor TaxID=29722 RepID=UPI0025892270|nr:F-box/LRR-repeat protein 10 [Amaranthus tricolor]
MERIEGDQGEEEKMGLEHLPSALLATIIAKLDMASICSVASTCRTFKSCASHILTFLPTVHLMDIAPSMDLLVPLLPPNPYLTSLKIDCCRLDDSAINNLIRPSLQELFLHNCGDFSGRLLSEIGTQCCDLRSLYLGSVGEKRGRAIHISDLEELLRGCIELETLNLMFDVSIFLRHNFARAWTLASTNLTSLEIGYISSVMVTELLSPTPGPTQFLQQEQPPVLPNLQKLSLSVDYITDTMINTISQNLTSLIHLDLRDAPIIEPRVTFDLTNNGLQHINQHGKLKHLSLVRSQEFLITYFRRINDLGILLMADKCASMESICLGGFCRVTDTGFRAILHACTNLYKIKISHGTQLTDLVFHDISATPLSLTHVGLRWCNLLTNFAISHLASNLDLTVLDLRDCRSLGDEALLAISSLPKLKSLLVDGSDITDAGILHLRERAASSLVSLSVRGCKRLTDKCITALFGGSSNPVLQELDLSNLPNLSDNGVLLLAKSRVPICEFRMRQCPLIGDTSVMALASMQVDDDKWHGNCLRLLDLYNCGRITALSFRWLKKPYFPRLKWLGVTGSVNRDMVDALARSRPYLHVAGRGEELGTDQWDHGDGFYIHDYEETDELEQFIMEDDDEISDEEMAEAEDNEEFEE